MADFVQVAMSAVTRRVHLENSIQCRFLHLKERLSDSEQSKEEYCMIKLTLMVNGVAKQVICEQDESLANVLRENLGLTSVKIGCATGQCGSCSVIVDGKLVRSCSMKMKRVKEGAVILTTEGIGTPDNLHPIQVSWIANGGAQCGFCTPGFIVSSYALLQSNPSPTREDIRNWFQNTATPAVYRLQAAVDSVMDAAAVMRGECRWTTCSSRFPKMVESGHKVPSSYRRRKVTGTLDYGADLGIKMPTGTLKCALVQAEVSHAKIISIDTSEAEKMPGVEKSSPTRTSRARTALPV